MQNLYIKQY